MLIEVVTLFIGTSVFVNTLLNSFVLRHVRNLSVSVEESIAVLLPMRNESVNVAPFIATLRLQENIPNANFYCLDDQSSDETYSKLQESTQNDLRFHIYQGAALPEGWIGKPFALQQIFESSSADIVVLLDADVRLTPHAIASSVSILKASNLDFFSAYPRQIAVTWSERLIQPLLQWSWLATVPLRLAEKLRNSSFAVANGQFFIVRRSALLEVDGFKRISNQVLDDISLARLLLKSGFRGTVGDASSVAKCRMYESWEEIKSGYGKSLRTAFKGPLGFAVGILFLLFTGLIPLVLTLSGSAIGAISLLGIIASRLISARSSGGRISDSLLHPISVSLLIYLTVFSIVKRNKILWKGRPV